MEGARLQVIEGHSCCVRYGQMAEGNFQIRREGADALVMGRELAWSADAVINSRRFHVPRDRTLRVRSLNLESEGQQMNRPVLRPRLLLIEDDPARIEKFRGWSADTEFVLIEASSAGRAMGILRPGMVDGVAGILLDHDLEKQPVTDSDLRLSASNLLDSIVRVVPGHVPVLIHSMNASQPPVMERRLVANGFSVTRVRMSSLTPDLFATWLDDVRDNWETNANG